MCVCVCVEAFAGDFLVAYMGACVHVCISFVGFWVGRCVYVAIFLYVPGTHMYENQCICKIALWEWGPMPFSLCACVCYNWGVYLYLAFHRQVPVLEVPGLRSFKG